MLKFPNQSHFFAIHAHRSIKSNAIENIRQIDCVLVRIKDKWGLQNAFSSDDLYVGEDHRTITAILKVDRKANVRKKNNSTKKETRHNFKAWAPLDEKEYAATLDKYKYIK